MLVICHYGEIGLKGKNRRFFEEKLVENIKKALGGGFFKQVRRISGRILVEPKEGVDRIEVAQKLKKIFGIAYFAFAEPCFFQPTEIRSLQIETLKEKAIDLLKTKKFKTFKIDTKRSDKNFPLTSQQVNEVIGEAVLKKLNPHKFCKAKIVSKNQKLKIGVDFKSPDIILFIEIVEKYAFLYTEKIRGLGGLPVGVSGKGLCLLSGGIDSPVASFYAMKRGIETVFIHFHAVPYAPKSSIEKVEKLVKILNNYQFASRLYLVPFAGIQKEILLKTKAKLRVVLYRRFMVRIAQEIAEKEGAKVLITGENVGQVASQTIENLSVIDGVAEIPILRPLICWDKQEIIEKAKEIGAYDISILPHDDCCVRFLPKNPATKAALGEVKREEAKLDVEKLIKKAIGETKVVTDFA